jgi:spoIIIJ-associated protein
MAFSPMRMTAATEEAAVAQVLQLVGESRDAVSVEVLSQNEKGVTVRVSPRRADEAASVTATSPQDEATEDAGVDITSIESASETESERATPEAEDDAQTEELIDEATESVPGISAPYTEERAEQPLSETAVNTEAVASAPRENVREALPALDEETQQRACATAQDFLDRMGLDAQATLGDASQDASARCLVNVDGEDVGILIGKHGQTLQSFQYLLNVTLNNALESSGEGERKEAVRVVVDAGGYRARRMGSLQQMARDAAERVKRDRRPFRLEPMPAHERRLVHMELQQDAELATSSEGREPMRYIVVAPAGYQPSASDRGGRGGFNRNRNSGGNRGGNRGGFGRGR